MKRKKSTTKEFIGIDLHTAKFNCCFLTSGEDGKREFSFPVSDEGITAFLSVAGRDSFVMVEASCGTFEFVSRIKDHVGCCYIANPHKLKLISMVKKKTDKIDAEKLALFLKMQILSGEELIKPVYMPEKTIRQLRSCFTNYKTMTGISVQIKNAIHAVFKQHLICIPRKSLSAKTKREAYIDSYNLSDAVKSQLRILFNQLKQTEENIKSMEELIMVIGSEYYKEVELLTSIKGVSIIMALALIADIATIDRFPNAKHLCSYLRSTPSVDSSGETVRIGRTNKFGRKLSISLLSQSALHFRKAHEQLDTWYLTKSKTKGRGKMRMALLRKMIVQVYHILSNKEYHRYRDEANHLRKMKAYNSFLQKNEILIKKAA
jgi:transposase